MECVSTVISDSSVQYEKDVEITVFIFFQKKTLISQNKPLKYEFTGYLKTLKPINRMDPERGRNEQKPFAFAVRFASVGWIKVKFCLF